MGRPRKYFVQEVAPAHPEILPRRKRAKTIRQMGHMPEVTAGEIQRIEQTEPNLRSAEPFSFPRAVMVKEVQALRRVVEAELEELLDWGVPKFQVRFPRCSRESVMPMLRMATRGGKMYFVRTDNACALFVAEVTPWEPLLFVYEVFVVSRIVAPWEERKLRQAGRDWAKDIKACEFRFKDPVVEDAARVIGWTDKETWFTLRFDTQAAAIERVIDGSALLAGVVG